MTWLIYLLDIAIVGTYLLLVLGRTEQFWFDWTNAACGPCIILLTVATIGWQPVLLLTVAFSIAGWIGVIRNRAAHV